MMELPPVGCKDGLGTQESKQVRGWHQDLLEIQDPLDTLYGT